MDDEPLALDLLESYVSRTPFQMCIRDSQKTEQSDGKFKSQSAYTGNYTLNGGLTIYNGSKLTRTIRQQQITNIAQEYQVNIAKNDIEIAVTEAYLQILYANESLKTNHQTLETSAAQLARSKELLAAGSIAPSDYAQIEAQYSNCLLYTSINPAPRSWERTLLPFTKLIPD